MQKVSLEVQNDVALVRLTNGVTNAISPELVSDLGAAVDQLKKECRCDEHVKTYRVCQ